MRFAGRRWYAIRPDHAQRVGEDPPHVRLVHHEEDGDGAWICLEHSLRGFIRRHTQHLRDLRERLASYSGLSLTDETMTLSGSASGLRAITARMVLPAVYG